MRAKRLIKRESELTDDERQVRKQTAQAKAEEFRQKRLEDRLAKLKQKADEYEALKFLTEKYPDLDVSTDRWGQTYYGSRAVNAIADKVEFRRSCGCCPDAEIQAMPYIESDFGRIYSFPQRFGIGEGTVWGGFVYASPKWKETCREAGISENLIDQMQEYLTSEAREAQDNDD